MKTLAERTAMTKVAQNRLPKRLWDDVDWTQHNDSIAKSLQVTGAAVAYQRKKRKLPSNARFNPLAPKQQMVLSYMKDYCAKNDNIPSTRQIQKHFGWVSQTSAVTHIKALIKKGFIEVVPNGCSRTSYRFSRKQKAQNATNP